MSSYDEVPYTSYPYARTHPDRLCTVARLFGMQPTPIEHCRVLEIGCASGGNIVPMAELLPESEFVGLDASEKQVAAGRELISVAGLRNVRLEHVDLLEVDASWGTFDYIICHGVYSWVPADVQNKILTVMRDLLVPHGVGYLSYNVYPGWHLRESIRHMMRYHVRSMASPEERTAQAGALIDFLATHVPQDEGPFALLLKRELQVLKGTKGDYLFHEHLEEVNEPLYFHQMAERLARHDLAYLGESDIHTMQLQQYAPKAAEALDRVASDLISMEQYMDFVRNRQFRASLVCHADAPLERNVSSARVEGMFVSFAAGPDNKPVDLSPGLMHEFVSCDNVKVASERAITKAAFVILRARWPRPVEFEELYTECVELLSEGGLPVDASARGQLMADLLECCFGGAGVSLRSWSPPVALRPSERPCTTRAARAQAGGGHVASLLHETVHLDRAPARLLELLDGTRTEGEIIDALAGLVVSGSLELSREGQPISDPDAMRGPLAAVLRDTLPRFARQGLLVNEGAA